MTEFGYDAIECYASGCVCGSRVEPPEPVGVLGISAAKSEHSVRQRSPTWIHRPYTNQNRAVMATFNRDAIIRNVGGIGRGGHLAGSVAGRRAFVCVLRANARGRGLANSNNPTKYAHTIQRFPEGLGAKPSPDFRVALQTGCAQVMPLLTPVKNRPYTANSTNFCLRSAHA